MKDEPFLMINDFLEKDRHELENVIEALNSKPKNYYSKAVFLRNFSNFMFKAYNKQKNNSKNDNSKLLLENRKNELLEKLKAVETKSINLETKEVIMSKESGKSLVNCSFDGTKYIVSEPSLDLKYLDFLSSLKKNLNPKIIDSNKLKSFLKSELTSKNLGFSEDVYDKLRYYLIRDINKYGVISPLIEDKNVKEIVCGGSGNNIHIKYDANSDVITNIMLKNDDEVNNIIKIFALKMKQPINKENPFLNGELEYGLVVQANYGTEFLKPKFVISKKIV